MNGELFRFLRKETRLRPKEFAERIGVDPKTVANWERAEAPNRQNDLTVRFFVAGEMFTGSELQTVISQLVKLSEYSWELEDEEDVKSIKTTNQGRMFESCGVHHFQRFTQRFTHRKCQDHPGILKTRNSGSTGRCLQSRYNELSQQLDNTFNLKIDLRALSHLDHIGLLATQHYNLGNRGNCLRVHGGI